LTWGETDAKAKDAFLPVAQANDNRTPAGQLKDGVLNLQLEIREAKWFPEDESCGYRVVHAFAEAGKTAQVAGPLIRVVQGTQIHATIHNLLPEAARVYGLQRHPGNAKQNVKLEAGVTLSVDFVAGEPGTYLYWAATADKMLDFTQGFDTVRLGPDTTLSGAFVVDPPSSRPDDRIFVIGVWQKDTTTIATQIPTINGKSWPHTERLTYHIGDAPHWRVINASFDPHAMHMHGFYFNVTGIGNGQGYETYADDQRHKVVTEFIAPGHTFDLTWTPERAGNWLFHCHMVFHMTRVGELHPKDEHAPEVHTANYSQDNLLSGMGGLVLGITVLPDKTDSTAANFQAAHKLQLVISDNPQKLPLYRVEVNDPPPTTNSKNADSDKKAADKKPSLLGPPIVIARGEPTEIEVKNQTGGPTVIHWHGIELESYYDGVAGWTGSRIQTTPPIPSGSSFVARMTPPRAGTFIYHTHWHDTEQIMNGVYGPLVVLEPGQKYDPEHDKTFVFGEGHYAPFGFMVLVNGSPQPDPVELQTGVRYRLRFVNITGDAADLKVKLVSKDATVSWKMLARDGADLPPSQLKSSSDEILIPVGGTCDVEYVADHTGFLEMQISSELFEARIMQPFDVVAKK
jgi:FtsP/CotA-like multicopper oxidase with cupredoxin domain